ncbi:MAG: hemerythrin family protein [Epulopiscium sp.]|nr:hemerythrin family protein [Candidatus Epulonipiscium sp.]
MQWDESLATGCSVIDKQHKELLKQVNKAIKAYQEGKAKKEVETTLQFLEEYVHTHFSMEEQLQIQYQYPNYKKHKKMHEYFIKEFIEIKQKYKQDGPRITITLALNRILITWLREHILKMDKDLADYIQLQ